MQSATGHRAPREATSSQKVGGAGLFGARAQKVALHVLEHDDGGGHLGGERPAFLADVLVGGHAVTVADDVRYPHDQAKRGEEAAADVHRRVAGVLLREAATGPQGDREECPVVRGGVVVWWQR